MKTLNFYYPVQNKTNYKFPFKWFYIQLLSILPHSFRNYAEIKLKRSVYRKYFDDNKCIFIHIPKAAGSSIALSLFGDQFPGHIKAERYHWENPKKFHNYFKFAFIRNPWDRVVSSYFYLKKGGLRPSDLVWRDTVLSKYDNFGDFVTNWLNAENIHTKIHFIPQIDFITINGELCVDYIGRFENIDNDFLKISDILKINSELVAVNQSIKKDYRTYYNNKTELIVYDCYKEEIEVFNYTY